MYSKSCNFCQKPRKVKVERKRDRKEMKIRFCNESNFKHQDFTQLQT